MDLTLDTLKESAAHIVSRIPTSDDRKKRAIDVPSEFMSPLYACVSISMTCTTTSSDKTIVWGGSSKEPHLEPPRCGTAVVSRAVFQVFSAVSPLAP